MSHPLTFILFAIFTQTACEPASPPLRAEIIHIDEFAPPAYVPPEKIVPTEKPEEPEPAELDPPSEENPLDLNAASAAELKMLPGVGPATAGRIVEYRDERRFEKLSHLKRVPGIGPKTFEKLAPLLEVNEQK